MKIREILSETDLDRIHQITKSSWSTIYSFRQNIMSPEIFETVYGDGASDKAFRVREWCQNNYDKTRVIEYEDTVVGFITWEYHSIDLIELCNNAIDPLFQRRGLGTALYEWFLEYSRENDYKYAFVFTGLDIAHRPALERYKKMGFSAPIETVRLYKDLNK